MAEHLSLREVQFLRIKTIVKNLHVEKLEKSAGFVMQILFSLSHVSTCVSAQADKQLILFHKKLPLTIASLLTCEVYQ